MTSDTNKHVKQSQSAREWLKRHKIIAVVIVAVLLLVSIVTVVNVIPARSVENFCKVYKENKTTLSSGDSNYKSLVDAYDKLEKVSPSEISPDVARIKTGYESALNDPSKTLGIGFGIMGETSRLNDYINQNCHE